MNVYELNMDGLVGPTHNYAGLALGNIAASTNALSTSNPQAAALQGLQKMRFLHQLGLKQAVIPPQQRPNLKLLYDLGFHGTGVEQIRRAFQVAPKLLTASYSASSMWTANAATVCPSTDSADQKVHFTAANLITNLHRHHEAECSRRLLQTIFADPKYFVHHPVLPRSTTTSDEGAANHNRLCAQHGQTGVHLFVYGKKGIDAFESDSGLKKYPARQTLEASQAIARNHLLKDDQVIFARQNPAAIDLGVFHNDVISVANESVFLVHEQAFCQQQKVLMELTEKASFDLSIIQIAQNEISIQDAVDTYLFNSQLISVPGQGMILIAPQECEHHPRVKKCINTFINDSTNPINRVYFFDLKQSMRNGGGPACLRLRVVLNDQELAAMQQSVLISDLLLAQLEQWVLKHYRTELCVNDLLDPELITESFTALDELTQILKLGSFYPFQQEKP